MASNKHVEWKKIKNFVKSKYYPEDISRDKERSKKGGYLSVIENFLYHTTTLFYCNRILIYGV